MFGHLTYLAFELAWALPIIVAHWALGGPRLRARLRTIAVATGAATIYLIGADAVALHAGIWTLHAGRIVGLRVGPVPVEECIFFLLTNLLVIQSIILLQPRSPRSRRGWFAS